MNLTIKQIGSIRIIGKASTISQQLKQIADMHRLGVVPNVRKI